MGLYFKTGQIGLMAGSETDLLKSDEDGRGTRSLLLLPSFLFVNLTCACSSTRDLWGS